MTEATEAAITELHSRHTASGAASAAGSSADGSAPGASADSPCRKDPRNCQDGTVEYYSVESGIIMNIWWQEVHWGKEALGWLWEWKKTLYNQPMSLWPMTRTHSRESLLLPIHLPSKKLKLKVEGCCVDDLSNNWTPSRVIIGFPFGIEHLWVVTRDAEFLVLPRLEWVHSFWLADHYGSDKQAQASLPRHKKALCWPSMTNLLKLALPLQWPLWIL